MDLIAYDMEEPFGPWRDNYHAAMLAHLFMAVYTKKGRRAPPIKDFMYTSTDSRREQNASTFLKMLRVGAKKAKPQTTPSESDAK